MQMNPSQQAAYNRLLDQALNHGTETAREIGAILLNSYNDRLPGTEFSVGRFRHFDAINRTHVLAYLAWFGSAPGLYPPSKDMDELKREWALRGWFDAGFAELVLSE